MDDLRLDWEKEGFASEFEVCEAKGNELILRAFSPTVSNLQFEHGISARVGKFFFVPSCGAVRGPIVGFPIERKRWTGAYLEEGLNAFFWGNAYDRIGVWALNPGVPYKIGRVGQNTRHGQKNATSSGRYLDWPGGSRSTFRQVELQLPRLPQRDDKAIRQREFEDAVLSRIRHVDEFSVVQPLSQMVGNS